MNIFEIHITGEKGINEELEALGVKNIVVELLQPDKTLLRTEYMSSVVKSFEGLPECFKYIDGLLGQLESKILRVKIETPYLLEYVKRSLYMESHFMPNIWEKTMYPKSRNARSGKIMATDREYDQSKYPEFRAKWKGEDLELCVYDTFVDEDKDWFDLYKK